MYERLVYRFVEGASRQPLRKVGLAGAPSRIRTYDLELRSLLLYPAELSGHDICQLSRYIILTCEVYSG